MKNIIEYLEYTSSRIPDKVAFICEDDTITFKDLRNYAFEYGQHLSNLMGGRNNTPICILGGRSIDTIVSMFACVYSGNFYIVIDSSLPEMRINQMIDAVGECGVIECGENAISCENLIFCDQFIRRDVENKCVLHQERNQQWCNKISSFDPLYGIFTSGSTGVPKLVVKNHSAMINFLEEYVQLFKFVENDIVGNQFPFYFDASTKDIYTCIKCGCTTHIIPKDYFSFPQSLIPYLINTAITRIVWVPSALGLIANSKAFDTIGIPTELKMVLFVGEQMPIKHLNYWKNHLPNTDFVNLYGPTEVAGNALYFRYETQLPDDSRLPAGKPFSNTKVMLFSQDGTEIRDVGVKGEICITGNTLSLGYYRDKERNQISFVQNPLVEYREIMYKTGDLAVYDDNYNVVWIARKDFQIKHMGYRIELSDIEIAIGSINEIDECCCIYDEENKRIVLFYKATSDQKKNIGKHVREKLPKYMYPAKYIKINELPHNANGKIDRLKLKNMIN